MTLGENQVENLEKKPKTYADTWNMQKALPDLWIQTQEAVMLTTTPLCCKKREHAEHAQPWKKRFSTNNYVNSDWTALQVYEMYHNAIDFFSLAWSII